MELYGGYDGDLVKDIESTHGEAISGVVKMKDIIITSSLDGTIVIYKLVLVNDN